MSQLLANSQVYNIVTENEVASILSRFNSEYIFDVIRDSLTDKYNYNFVDKPNVVAVFEQNFKHMQVVYPFDSPNIEYVRIETYREIINILCKEYQLQFNDTGDVDYYSLAYYMYDFLSSNFNNYMVSFFSNYIVKEKNNLYDSLNMESLKKGKDSSTLYNKKLYKDIKLAILNTNLNIVLYNMCAYDITLENILSLVYANKTIIAFMLTYILPLNDFYKTAYCAAFNTEVQPVIMTNIRLQIQNVAVVEN